MFAYITLTIEPVARAMADIDTYNPITHVSAFVVVECMAGDKVWVESAQSGGELYGYGRSAQFSGYLPALCLMLYVNLIM